jgi:transposase
MSRERVLTDEQWARIEPLMPSLDGQKSRPFRDHRQVVEGIIYRLRTGIAWRDLPASFGPWRTVWKRHQRCSIDGAWDRIQARLLARPPASSWTTQVDAAVAKVPLLRMETVMRSDEMKGFVVLPRRWVVERTFSWFGRNRRLAKDFENLAETLGAFVSLASIQLAFRRLARA